MDVCTPQVMLRGWKGSREGGRVRGLMGIEECVRRESKSLHSYLIESREWMLQDALKERMIVEE